MSISKIKNPVVDYWNQIEKGKVTVPDKIRRVYQKLVYDMNDKTSEWEYDNDLANHAIDFIERFCKHIEGNNRPFILEPWQRAMTAALFGFVHKKSGLRKFREFILIVARKNGKSIWGSAVALYMLIADGEIGPQVVSAATKKDQAKIIWSVAKKMINKSPALRKKTKALVGEIICPMNDGTFRPLSSDSNTLDGLNVHCSLIDELHAIQDKNLYDVIVDGMTAREQPLSIITSTAGTVRDCIFDIKYEECANVINGYFNDDEGAQKNERLLPIIYELDSRKEWIDPKCWVKANPGLGTIKSLEQLKDKVHKAQSNPLLVKNLLCKDFNIRETVSEAWLTFEQLNNQAVFSLADLKPRYGIGGADLSTTTDLTNATAIFKVPGDETIYVLQMYWLPEDLLEARERDDKIPYTVWRDMGLLRTTPGNKVNHKFVTEWFVELRNEHDLYIPWVGWDSWSADYWVDEMITTFGESCMKDERVIQGKKTLSGPMQNLGADLEAKKVNYNNHPILKWCLSNVAVEIDKNLNMQPCKVNNQRRRIDGFAGLLNAYVALERHYEDYMNLI